MSDLIKKFVTEDHEAIKAQYSKYDAENPTRPHLEVTSSTSSISFELVKMPHTITMELPEEMDRYLARFHKRDVLRPKMDQLKVKNPEAHDKMSEKFFKDEKEEALRKDMIDDVNREFAEMFDHLTTMLKTRLITYVHDLHAMHNKRDEEHVKELDAEISKHLSQE